MDTTLIFVDGNLPLVKNREKDCWYIHKDKIIYWDGKIIKCLHKRRHRECCLCKGVGVCEHNRRQRCCKICNGSQICEHKKIKSMCVTCSPNRQYFCQLCNSINVKNGPYYPLCFRCHCLSHPEEKIPRRFKLKQHYLYDKIKEVYGNSFIYDRTIEGGCSNKRPDFLFDLLTHSVVLEIDEDQHDGYSCENKRTMSIFNDLGNRPLVFIRFNPDRYNNVKGCFIFDEKNNIVVNKKEFEIRMKSLLEILQYHLDNVPTKEVTIVNLFFDE